METDVINSKMVMHVIISEIRNGHVMHVNSCNMFYYMSYTQLLCITCITRNYMVCSGMFWVPRTIYTVPTRVLGSKIGVTDPVLASVA